MEEEKRKAYSEVVEVLKLIECEQKIEQIPFEVIQLIKANSDPTYKPNISKDKPLEEQNLMDETYSILGWIANKYWGENIETENAQIDEKTKTEENKTETETETKDSDVLQEKDLESVSVYNDIEPECLEGSNLPAIIKDTNWYEKIKAQVIRIIKMIFRIKDKNADTIKE